MDWDKVIQNLRDQTTFYTNRANEYASRSGYYEMAKEMRASANTASILCSALFAGLTQPIDAAEQSKDQS
jgi:hypothetical protein